MYEADHDVNSYTDRGEYYGRDEHNSSHRTKAEFNNCFIIHSKYLY